MASNGRDPRVLSDRIYHREIRQEDSLQASSSVVFVSEIKPVSIDTSQNLFTGYKNPDSAKKVWASYLPELRDLEDFEETEASVPLFRNADDLDFYLNGVLSHAREEYVSRESANPKRPIPTKDEWPLFAHYGSPKDRETKRLEHRIGAPVSIRSAPLFIIDEETGKSVRNPVYC